MRRISHAVGYKRPPLEYCFKKGLSGNPRGRPKRATQNDLELLREVFRTPLRVGANRENISLGEQILRSLVNAALRSDAKAAELIVPFGELLDPRAPEKTIFVTIKRF
jgi:hypothetical protein